MGGNKRIGVTFKPVVVDDLNPEMYSYVIERLLAAGAQDAWLTPIVMKKGRPAATVSVLCAAAAESSLRRILFRETGTLGIRRSLAARSKLQRRVCTVATVWGPVQGKLSGYAGKPLVFKPEYESCARLAREHGVALREVYLQAQRAYAEKGGGRE